MNGDRLPFPKAARMVYFSLWLLCLKCSPESIPSVVVLLTLGRQCFLPDGVSRTESAERSCVVQGLQDEENGLLYRCWLVMPSGDCGSEPITCTAALGMTVEIFPGAECRLMEKGKCGGRQLKRKMAVDAVWEVGGAIIMMVVVLCFCSLRFVQQYAAGDRVRETKMQSCWVIVDFGNPSSLLRSY